MKFKNIKTEGSKEILANDHFVAVAYNCSNIEADENDFIEAGTVIPANDSTAEGILLNNVYKDEDPNGAVVIHGFIKSEKLPANVSDEAKAALKQITFI